MSSSSAAREPRFEFASSGRHLVATGVVRHVEPRSWVGTGVARAVEEVLAAPLEAPQLVVGVLPFDSARPGMLYRPAEACWRSCAFPGRPEPFAPSASTTAVTDRRPSHEGYRCLVAKAVETIRSGELDKVVLGRCATVCAAAPWDPQSVFVRLGIQNPDAFVYLIDVPGGYDGEFAQEGVFLGASPELVLSCSGSRVRTVPLAGTTAR